MKPNYSFSPTRRALIASAMAVLLGAATAVAQSSGAGSTSSGTTGASGSDTSRRNQSGTSSSSSGTYNPGSTTGASTTDPTTGSAGTSGSTYNSGTTSTRSAGAMTGRDTRSSSDKLSWSDRRFVHKAADGGQAEVQVAELAAQRATNPEVKNFAQKLVDDHKKVNSGLMSLAGQKGVKIDTDDDKDRAYKRLNKKTGSDFDQEFVEHMIDEHEKDIKMFEKAASDAKDPEVRSFASQHVGELREHLQQAQNLRQTLMPTGRMDDSSGRSTSGGTTGSGLGTSSTGSSPGTSDTSTTPRRDGSR